MSLSGIKMYCANTHVIIWLAFFHLMKGWQHPSEKSPIPNCAHMVMVIKCILSLYKLSKNLIDERLIYCAYFSTDEIYLTRSKIQTATSKQCAIHKMHDVLQINLGSWKMSEIRWMYAMISNINVIARLSHISSYLSTVI